MREFKKITIFGVMLAVLLTGVAFSQQEPPPYPTAFWILGALNAGTTEVTNLSNFKAAFYSQSGSPESAFADAYTQAGGVFQINAHDDLRLLPLEAKTYYLAVVKREIDGKDYGVDQQELALTDQDLINGYKSGISLTLLEDQGIVDPSGEFAITTDELPPGTVGTEYAANLEANGGTPPYTWSVDSGSLPAGLSLNANTGVISGTPTAAGTYNFNIKAEDSSSPAAQSDIKSFSILVNQTLGDGPVINITVLLEGFIGKATSVSIEARTGSAPGSAATVAGTCVIPLNANGSGTNNGNWAGANPADGNYYLAVKHQLTGVSAGINHLPVITNGTVALSTVAAAAVDLSSSEAAAYEAVYTPAGKVEAVKTLGGGRKALRAGNLNNDKIIDISDYGVWKGAVTAAGTVDPANPASVASDLNGDNTIDVTDYSLWKGTVVEFAPAGQPQTGDHIYAP